MAKNYNTVDDLSTGSVLTETWVDEVKENLDNMIVRPACRVRSGTDNVTPNNTFGTITFDTEDFDTDGMGGSGTAAITIQTAGIYTIGAAVAWATAAAGTRGVYLRLNGNDLIHEQADASDGFATALSVADVFALGSGDVLSMRTFQDSGGTLAILAATAPYSPVMWATWVGRTTAP